MSGFSLSISCQYIVKTSMADWIRRSVSYSSSSIKATQGIQNRIMKGMSMICNRQNTMEIAEVKHTVQAFLTERLLLKVVFTTGLKEKLY